ncbi:MAG: hypothetical protein J4F48_10280, partial [Nitrospinae bacterium]|nr:hypothetical protein [Nitrospinota bacterium]
AQGMAATHKEIEPENEFPKIQINSDKFTGFFAKLPQIVSGGNDAAGAQHRKNSAIIRERLDDGKCGELRGRISPGRRSGPAHSSACYL